MVLGQTCVATVLALTQTAFPTLRPLFAHARYKLLSTRYAYGISTRNEAFSRKHEFHAF